MRFQPRHYILLAVIIALAIWNIVRHEHARHAAFVTVHEVPQGTGWQAFDHAASLRDAPDPQFTPALDALRTQANAATGPDAADLRNCLMWLQYYRHSVPMAAGNSGNWGMLATSHVQTCMAEHRDIGR